MFTLRHKTTKKLIRHSIFSNEGRNFCNTIGVTIGESGDDLWAIEEKDNIENTLKQNTPWFNASYNCPKWGSNFKPEDWEIVELGDVSVKIKQVEKVLYKTIHQYDNDEGTTEDNYAWQEATINALKISLEILREN